MISNTRVSLLAMLFALIVAASNSGCGGGGSAATSQSLTITTGSLPNGTVNVPYNATLQSTGGTPPLKWSLGPSLPPGLALNSNGTISGTPTAPGSSCFTVSATDSSMAVPPTEGLCIGINQPDSSHNQLLNGHYAFLINRLEGCAVKILIGCGMGFGISTQIATAGSFVADGAGNITGGVSDTSGLGVGLVANEPFTGTYALGADNRGTLSISTRTETVGTYAFSVGSMSASGVATKGRFIAFGTEIPASKISASGFPGAGEFQLQDPVAFSNSAIGGSYAFVLSGRDADTFGDGVTQLGSAGVFTADGNGGITTGTADFNGPNQPLTGTYDIAANSADGRGTGTFAIAGTTLDFAFYVVSGNKMLIVSQSLVAGLGSLPLAFSGQALQQSGGLFDSSSLSGASVFRTATAGQVGFSSPAELTVGLETFDGRATVTVLQDQNAGGTVTLDTTTTSSYGVASNGRVTITAAGAPISVLYLVRPGTGFILNADGSTGFFEPQSATPFTDTSIDGNFFFGDLPIPLLSTISSGVATLKAGAMSLTSDIDEDGTLVYGQSSQDNYTVAANGRATTGSGKQVIYIISPTKFLMINVDPTNTTPGITVAEQ